MAFQQGLSGLNSSSKALDVISNNISNASTVGFKGGQAQFADVFAASVGGGGAGGSQVGIGAQLSGVAQQFTQGNISNSNNPLDIAINGSGFFRLQKSLTDSTISYTRNGQYHLDERGYVVNAQKYNLTGFPVTNNIVDRSKMIPVQLNTQGIAPIATGSAVSNAGVQLQINLDDREARSLYSATPNNLAPWAGVGGNTSFPPNSLNTFDYSTSLQIYDQKGNAHTLSMYFTRIEPGTAAVADKNMWDVHFVMDTTDITKAIKGGTNAAATVGTQPVVEFSSAGGIVKSGFSAPTHAATTDTVPLTRAVDFQFKIDQTALVGLNAAFTNLFPQDIPIDVNNSTMFGSGYDVNKLVQDGYPYGRLTGVSISPNGVLKGNYSNGQSQSIVQLVLADFISPTGLLSVGNNQWQETAASGQPLIGDPGSGSRGLLQSSAVEDANIDLTQELVNLITSQRNYQANAQSIKTQDQVMQTLVNMR